MKAYDLVQKGKRTADDFTASFGKAYKYWKENPAEISQKLVPLSENYQRLLMEGQKAGLPIEEWLNYAPHTLPGTPKKGFFDWMLPSEIAFNHAESAGGAGGKIGEFLPSFGKERTLPTILDRFEQGIPTELNAFKNYVTYADRMWGAIYNKNLIDTVLSKWGQEVTFPAARKLLEIPKGEDLYIAGSKLKELGHFHSVGEDIVKPLWKMTDDLKEEVGTKLGFLREEAGRIATQIEDTKAGAAHLTAEALPGLEARLANIKEVIKNTTLTPMKAYQMPSSVADVVNNFMRQVDHDPGFDGFRQMYGKISTLAKSWWTAGMPYFWIRHRAGEVWKAYLDCGPGITQDYFTAHKALATYKQLLKDKIYDWDKIPELVRHGLERGGIDQGYWTRTIAGAADHEIDAMLGSGKFKKAIEALNPLDRNNLWLRAGSHLVKDGENLNRLAVMSYHMRHGLSAEEAGARAFHSQFDYAPVLQGGLDKAAGKIFFFWTFISRNIPYHVEQMIEHPGRFSVVPKAYKLGEKGGETPEELEYRRPYMEETAMVPIPNYNGSIVHDSLDKLSKMVQIPAGWLATHAGAAPEIQKWFQQLSEQGFNHNGTIYVNPNMPWGELAKFSVNHPVEDIKKEALARLNPLIKWVVESVTAGQQNGQLVDPYTGSRYEPGAITIAPTWMQFLNKMFPRQDQQAHSQLVQGALDRLGVVRGNDGLAYVPTKNLNLLQTLLPPLNLLQRMTPPMERPGKDFVQYGKAYDKWLLALVGTWTGIRMHIPEVEVEKIQRVKAEAGKVQENVAFAKRLKMFPEEYYKKGKTKKVEFQGEQIEVERPKKISKEYKFQKHHKVEESPADWLARIRKIQGGGQQ
jgi:hypothetical protein